MKRARIEVDARPWGQVVEFTQSRSSEPAESREPNIIPDQTGVPADHAKAAGEPPFGPDLANTHPRLVDRKMQATLGRHLRVMFDDVARAPVPDKFMDLLQNLEMKEKEQHG